MNAVSEPMARTTVATRAMAVPSRANPREVNAAKPRIIVRYAVRKRSSKRSSELGVISNRDGDGDFDRIPSRRKCTRT